MSVALYYKKKGDEMNLLKNKKVLRGLLEQGDILNTINGGVSQASLIKEQMDEYFSISVSAPSVPAEAFNVVLNDDQLIIFAVLPNSTVQEDDQLFNIPMFYKSFDLPNYIDIENIEALHDDEQLIVTLPFKLSARYNRKIDIKHL